MARGMLIAFKRVWFGHQQFFAENVHVITEHHRAVLFNKDAFARDFSFTPVQVPCSLSYSSWAVEGMVVTSSPEEHPTVVLLPSRRHRFAAATSPPRGGLCALLSCC